METLTQMRCVACRKDAPTVTDAEIAEFHRQVSDWDIVEPDGIESSDDRSAVVGGSVDPVAQPLARRVLPAQRLFVLFGHD